jgi:hypothetical protein
MAAGHPDRRDEDDYWRFHLEASMPAQLLPIKHASLRELARA